MTYLTPREDSQFEKPEDCPDFPHPDPYRCNCRFSVECWEGWHDEFYFKCYPEESQGSFTKPEGAHTMKELDKGDLLNRYLKNKRKYYEMNKTEDSVYPYKTNEGGDSVTLPS